MYKHPEELAFYTHFLIPRMGGVEMGLDCSVCVCVCLTIADLCTVAMTTGNFSTDVNARGKH